jgi:hypothetical protein
LTDAKAGGKERVVVEVDADLLHEIASRCDSQVPLARILGVFIKWGYEDITQHRREIHQILQEKRPR